MKTIKLEIELTYDDDECLDGEFYEYVLGSRELQLFHVNRPKNNTATTAGPVGEVKVLSIKLEN